MNTPRTRLIDANIILRFLLQDDKILFERARKLFRDAQGGLFLCYVDEVTIAEVVWVLTSVYKIKRDDLVQKIEALMVQQWVINVRKNTILRAFAFYRMSTLNYIDCWLLAVSEEKHFSLETFDVKLSKRQKKGY